MKKTYILPGAIYFTAIAQTSAQNHNDPIGTASIANRSWQKGGIFQDYKPDQEILSTGTAVTKKINTGNGLIMKQPNLLQHMFIT